MALKTFKYINIFIIFFLCFPFHFMYDWCPNALFSIMFPVNESIWEHMKMLYSSVVVCGLLEYAFLKKYNGYLPALFIKSFISIPIFLILYLPLYSIFGENFVLNLIVLFVTIVIIEIVDYYLLIHDVKQDLRSASIIGIVLVYVLFGILTYYPPKIDLFYDYSTNKYGINTYKS